MRFSFSDLIIVVLILLCIFLLVRNKSNQSIEASAIDESMGFLLYNQRENNSCEIDSSIMVFNSDLDTISLISILQDSVVYLYYSVFDCTSCIDESISYFMNNSFTYTKNKIMICFSDNPRSFKLLAQKYPKADLYYTLKPLELDAVKFGSPFFFRTKNGRILNTLVYEKNKKEFMKLALKYF